MGRVPRRCKALADILERTIRREAQGRHCIRAATPHFRNIDGNSFVGAADRETARAPAYRWEPDMLQSSSSKTESWENEGGSVEIAQLTTSLGITRQTTETYVVGSYRYTNLADAVAQAQRMAKLERDLL